MKMTRRANRTFVPLQRLSTNSNRNLLYATINCECLCKFGSLWIQLKECNVHESFMYSSILCVFYVLLCMYKFPIKE